VPFPSYNFTFPDYSGDHLFKAYGSWTIYLCYCSNERSARLSGVPVNKVAHFRLCHIGIFLCSGRHHSNRQTVDCRHKYWHGNELDVIAAVVIGGASLQGGEGTVAGAIIGATIMAIVRKHLFFCTSPTIFKPLPLELSLYWQFGLDQILKRKVTIYNL